MELFITVDYIYSTVDLCTRQIIVKISNMY